MSAFDRKRTLGAARLTEGQREKGPLAKKNADTEEVSFLRFQNWAMGVGLYAAFPDRRATSRFCSFHAAQAPLRVVKMTHRGQAVFLSQLVEEEPINSQSSSRGSGKWRQLTTSK